MSLDPLGTLHAILDSNSFHRQNFQSHCWGMEPMLFTNLAVFDDRLHACMQNTQLCTTSLEPCTGMRQSQLTSAGIGKHCSLPRPSTEGACLHVHRSLLLAVCVCVCFSTNTDQHRTQHTPCSMPSQSNTRWWMKISFQRSSCFATSITRSKSTLGVPHRTNAVWHLAICTCIHPEILYA